MEKRSQGIKMVCEIQMDSIEYIEKKPLVSVIIPVYNVSRYLPQCLDSVTSQTYQNLEIVIVDDGSTDGSGSICAHYAERDDHILLIRSENKGLASARNLGLGSICGEYISFIDSDDWVEPHMIEKLLEAALQTGADIVTAKKCFEYVGATLHDEGGDEYPHIYSGEDLMLVLAEAKFGNTVWNKLYKAKCFKETRFPDGLNYEDVSTTLKVMKEAAENGGSLVSLPDVLFHYRVRKSSILNTYSFKNNIDSWTAHYSKYIALSGYREKILSECIEPIRRMWMSFPGYSEEEKAQARKTIREMQAFSRKNLWKILGGRFTRFEKMTCLLSQSRSLFAMRLVSWGSRLRQDYRLEKYIFYD